MCLVLSIVLAALGFNFYLNGFYIQAALMGLLSIGFLLLMIRNISCRRHGCGVNKTEPKEIKEEQKTVYKDQNKVDS